ncbi:MAG: periplasmic heavy metal sensor [Paracoccaceae bacterium]
MTRRRILRIAFVTVACLSLLLNAVVIGVGLRLADRGWFAASPAGALADMPREMRQSFVAALRAERPRLRGLADDLRAQRTEMLKIAAQEPVDRVALEAAMANVRAATTRVQSAAHSVILKTVDKTASRE